MSQEIISHISEFQILYTSQITQKIKKWCDGTLKFYRFNNKAEIWADSGTLVGSCFLKNDHCLEEKSWGNEFKAGGLLISIDSLLAETTRDIHKVFQKSAESRTPLKTKTINVQNTTQKCIDTPPISRRPAGLSRSSIRAKAKSTVTPSKKTSVSTEYPPLYKCASNNHKAIDAISPDPVSKRVHKLNSSCDKRVCQTSSISPVRISRPKGEKIHVAYPEVSRNKVINGTCQDNDNSKKSIYISPAPGSRNSNESISKERHQLEESETCSGGVLLPKARNIESPARIINAITAANTTLNECLTDLSKKSTETSRCGTRIKKEKTSYELELEQEEEELQLRNEIRIGWDDGINDNELLAQLQDASHQNGVTSLISETAMREYSSCGNGAKVTTSNSSTSRNKLRRINRRTQREILGIDTPIEIPKACGP